MFVLEIRKKNLYLIAWKLNCVYKATHTPMQCKVKIEHVLLYDFPLKKLIIQCHIYVFRFDFRSWLLQCTSDFKYISSQIHHRFNFDAQASRWIDWILFMHTFTPKIYSCLFFIRKVVTNIYSFVHISLILGDGIRTFTLFETLVIFFYATDWMTDWLTERKACAIFS